MNFQEQRLLKEIAEEHNVSSKVLLDIIKSAKDFNYQKTTGGQRINEYHGLIKYGVSQQSK